MRRSHQARLTSSPPPTSPPPCVSSTLLPRRLGLLSSTKSVWTLVSTTCTRSRPSARFMPRAERCAGPLLISTEPHCSCFVPGQAIPLILRWSSIASGLLEPTRLQVLLVFSRCTARSPQFSSFHLQLRSHQHSRERAHVSCQAVLHLPRVRFRRLSEPRFDSIQVRFGSKCCVLCDRLD